ncbi:MAG: VOC family protein [Candidatus Tectomicrobia bacterium]|uniref:VOC family protein n=1 Tax=Tectimicrobiota bacterium TaxID=2528274 RepID=A0A932M0R6_UNCTE|nr:VOC family protein [Candidatus Tectomicrobia bacterium]
MANPFVHVELHTQDPAQAKKFYKSLFSWGLEDLPMGEGTYTMINVGEGTGGGIMKNPVPETPSHWLAYVLVGDVKGSTKKARELGATVVQEVTEIPDYGWFSVIVDPAGAALGLWQPKAQK